MRFALSAIGLNHRFPIDGVVWQRRVGRLRVTFEWRSRKNLWGRFGGGWNWELGFEAGGKTLVLNLLVASLRFDWERWGEEERRTSVGR